MTATAPVAQPKMSHREIMQALTGLLMGMFVSILAGTVVSSSLPVIVSDLDGGQTAFTWVVTATLLATTISTPIWGKLADLGNRKLLLQLALAMFVLASAAAGFAQNTEFLIAMRVVQGLAGGGMGALSQIVMADILSPRERGKYMGLFGAVMAVGTVGGPLIGGFITDTINWRWNFFVALPFAVVAILLIQRTLHLPAFAKRKVTIDYLGIMLLSSGVALLLIWLYMIMARGATATQAGLMTFPMMAGLLVISTIAGALITRFGKWKAFVVTGSILQVIGLFLLGTIHYDTDFVLVGVYMFILGAGVGLVMQNMVLVVQNAVPVKELGVASSAVNFFRTLGGTAGTAGLGALLAINIPNMIADRQSDLAKAMAALGDKAAEVSAHQEGEGQAPAPAPVVENSEGLEARHAEGTVLTEAPAIHEGDNEKKPGSPAGA